MPPRPYQDNPFEPSSSRDDVDDYYGDIPPAHRLSAGLYPTSNPSGGSQRIPLTPTSPQPYSQNQGGYLPAQSTDSLAPISAGYGMSTGRYMDLPQQQNVRSGGGTSRQYPPQSKQSSRKKWIIMGTLLTIAGLIIAGVVAGVLVSRKKNNLAATSPSSSSSSPPSPTSLPQSDPNDPSVFTKNPAFFPSFWGMSYTPAGSQLPDCGNTLAGVITDMQVMSQLTSRVHLYGADCNQSQLVLEAIRQTKVNMTVWLANYPLATDNGTAYLRQRGELQKALQIYGADHVGGVSVGNEFMLNYVTQNNIPVADINGPQANVGAQILVADIQDTRSMLAGMNLSKTIPVGTADAGSYFNNLVLEACDYGMANVHPWFANTSIQDAAAWTAEFFQQNNVDLANNLTNKPNMYIAETGWPTKSSSVADETDGPSNASVANLQIFLDTFVCQANANGTEYFFFEFEDELWKDQEFGGVEGWWGLLNMNVTLKDGLTIPNCPSP